MIDLITALSDATKVHLTTAGWPPLRNLVNGEPGRILLIDSHRLDQYMPPRISMMPESAKFGAKDPTRGTSRVAGNASSYDAESRAAINNPSIGSELVTFEVRCWGIASDTEEDPYGADFEYTRALYNALNIAANEIMSGCYKFEDGKWMTVAHLERVGREFVCGLTIALPILSRLSAPTGPRELPRAPVGVHPVVTDQMTIGTGASSPGCEE